MKVKKVNRYYCDHCKKSGCSAHHIRKHEKGCTLNPERECGMCKMVDSSGQRPLAELMALLPDITHTKNRFGFECLSEEMRATLDAAFASLREATGNCPACILAAIRQRYHEKPYLFEFDFKKEVKEVWDNINEANTDSHNEYY